MNTYQIHAKAPSKNMEYPKVNQIRIPSLAYISGFLAFLSDFFYCAYSATRWCTWPRPTNQCVPFFRLAWWVRNDKLSKTDKSLLWDFSAIFIKKEVPFQNELFSKKGVKNVCKKDEVKLRWAELRGGERDWASGSSHAWSLSDFSVFSEFILLKRNYPVLLKLWLYPL